MVELQKIDSAACREIVSIPMDRYRKHLPDKIWEQVNARTGYHYRLLAWLSTQYRNARFTELGTRFGAGAMCLAYEPSNLVRTFDITEHHLKRAETNFDKFPRIHMYLEDAAEIDQDEFDKEDIILLDLSHTGEPERKVLATIERSLFKGLLIVDDCDWWKFPELYKIWDEIKHPKRILPYCHYTGTGLVDYSKR